RDEQPAVGVVRREEIGDYGLDDARLRPQLELLAEPAHAPLEGHRHGVLSVLEPGETEPFDDVVPHQLALAPAGQLEHAAAGREDAPVPVADDEAGVRPG